LTTLTTSPLRARTAARSHDSNNLFTARRHRFDDSYNFTARRHRFDGSNNLTVRARRRRDLTTLTTSSPRRRHRFDDSYNLITASMRTRGIPTTRRRRRRASTKEHGYNRELGRQDHCKIWYNGWLGGSISRQSQPHERRRFGSDLSTL